MSVLAGRQFFSWEIAPVLEAASKLPCGGQAAALLVSVNAQADADQTSDNPPVYTETLLPSLWTQADAALAPCAQDASIAAMVSQLAAGPPGVSGGAWRGLALVAGIVAAVGVGWWWVRR